ncbi:MAG: ABC transporter permease [Firmicutes bacterium]|nr:ABC transporter permease [Bacillota bacterium]
MLLWRQFVMEWKLYLRDRGATFWTFAFPVILLLGFGFMFREGAGPMTTLVWVTEGGGHAEDAALTKALTHVKILKLDSVEAQHRWAKGETAAQLESSAQGHRLRVNSYLMAQGQTAAQMVQQANLVVQAQAKGLQPEVIPISVESPGGRRNAGYGAFLLPGLLGVNLLSIGLFGVGMVNVAYREKGKFRRLGVTPLPKWIFLLGQILQRLTVSLAQASFMVLVARLALNIRNQGSYPEFFLAILMGTAAFMAMGFALSTFTKTLEGYSALSNVVFLPLMILSGVYFTLDAAPLWIQKVLLALPLAPYVKALRGIFNDGAHLWNHAAGLALVMAWGLVCFFIAVKRFRWN